MTVNDTLDLDAADNTDAEGKAPEPDLEAIAPDEGKVYVGGVQVRVKRLKFREILSLARIVSNGAGAGMSQFSIDTSSPEAMQTGILGILTFALPNAADETFEFLQQVVEPVNTGNQAKKQLQQAMDNPELDEVLDVINLLVGQEMDDIFELVGKVKRLANSQQDMFQQMQERRKAS